MSSSPKASEGAWLTQSRRPTLRLTFLPSALTVLLAALTLVPPIHGDPPLATTFLMVACTLALWQIILWVIFKSRNRDFTVDFVSVPSHYVQACVQSCILAYWGWFAREVFQQAHLILAQVLFLYILDALLSWSRGRTWRLGFGPLPIVFSTNLLLWFKADVFIYQFLMLTTGALAKQFITWNRDGRLMHIFNPSAFGQFLFALVLIATGTTNEFTWGKQIAASFETPHMLVVIFLGGIIVQYLFHVTLMTVSAAVVLCLVNLLYFHFIGTYFFVNVNVAAPIFLGIHLLITDPATSPRTNLGQVIFGALYALAYCLLFRLLDIYEVPLFWDKLLPVPILNLCVPLIDRLARSGVIGSFNRKWQLALAPPRLNLLHMAGWLALFTTMWATGFIDAAHPGNSIPFWKKALADGKPHAAHSLVMAAGTQAEAGGSGAAFNELGLICIEGKIVNENHGAAARYFAKACELGDINGCANVAAQFLFLHERRSDEDLLKAIDNLERDCNDNANWRSCLLVGVACEIGRGRPLNLQRAIECYIRCGPGNVYACKGLARIALTTGNVTQDLTDVVGVLTTAAETGDVESCWYLAYMYHLGKGVPCDPHRTRTWLERACKLGSEDACKAARQPTIPPYTKPRMLVPNWSTAFPLP